MPSASHLLAPGLAWGQRWLRSNALAQVALAVVVGALAGAAVTAMSFIAEAMHVAIYGIPFDQRLSASAKVAPAVALASLGLGGLTMGLFQLWRRRRGRASIVDPIEANALRGGRLSLNDSLVVVAQTLISNGCGASVGLEAGYAQIGSAIASRLGSIVRLGRQDLRTMVGCGAAGAMAAAFAAPLTGAFYAFELIIGAYTLATAAPVLAAAVAGVLVARTLGGAPYVIHAPLVLGLSLAAHVALIGLGLISAALGVLAMRAAALMERGFLASRLPAWARPVAGGLIIAAFAIYTPQALGAGHGALDLDITLPMSGGWLAALILIKLTACLVSLASGFRGGLFFASLFVGALLGKLYALAFVWAVPGVPLDATACIFAGMATLGVAIVGGPLTMAFLVLESSGDLPVAGGVLAACIATSLTVRLTFGYSFSTWRLHLRGETIRGAFDVGWQRDLTVARLMERDPVVGRAEETLAEFRASHTHVGAAHLALEDAAGRYAGIVDAAEAFAPQHAGELPLSALARLADVSLSPEMGVKDALVLFETSRSELLAVVDPESGALLGTLGEAVAARRYAEALANAARGMLDPN